VVVVAVAGQARDDRIDAPLRRRIELQRHILVRRDAGALLGKIERGTEAAQYIDQLVLQRIAAAPDAAFGDGLDRGVVELAALRNAMLEAVIDVVDHGVEPVMLARRKILE